MISGISVSYTHLDVYKRQMLNISARFVDPDEALALKNKQYHSFPHDLGSVYIRQIPASRAKTVSLGLSRFFKRITVDVIYSA